MMSQPTTAKVSRNMRKELVLTRKDDLSAPIPVGTPDRARKEAKRQVWLVAGGLCYYCKADIRDCYTFDHKIPKCKGGRTRKDNLVLSCFDCNNRKGTQDYEIFISL